MALIVRKINDQIEVLKSANTPDYEGQPDTLINPDIEHMQGVPLKYWKLENDQVLEMTQNEKQVIDEKENDKKVQPEALTVIDMAKILIAKGYVTKQEIKQYLLNKDN